jgi:hypothetical protein
MAIIALAAWATLDTAPTRADHVTPGQSHYTQDYPETYYWSTERTT